LRYFHFVSFLLFVILATHRTPSCPRFSAAFSPCWHALPVLGIVALLLPGSMNSGGGYSVVEVQLTKLILFFCIQFSILRFQLNIPFDIRQ
ncbi:MAG: hypothetical protein OSJ58_20755, partial [Dysosmobacter sp.]|nr:hypothetical protein [Dysosmobacter sp.]